MMHDNPRLAALADIAVDAIRALVSDPGTPPAVRLRAAKLILESTTGPGNDGNEDHTDCTQHTSPSSTPPAPTPSARPKVGRNECCPCGSGLKFKRCCLGKPQQGGRPVPREGPLTTAA